MNTQRMLLLHRLPGTLYRAGLGLGSSWEAATQQWPPPYWSLPWHFTHIRIWTIKTIFSLDCAMFFLKLATLGPYSYITTGQNRVGEVLFRKGLCFPVCQTPLAWLAPKGIWVCSLWHTLSCLIFAPTLWSKLMLYGWENWGSQMLSTFPASGLDTCLWVSPADDASAMSTMAAVMTWDPRNSMLLGFEDFRSCKSQF